MKYKIVDLELTETLSEIALSPHEMGIALILRHTGRVLGFIMHSEPDNRLITPETLNNIISQQASLQILQAKIRAELIPPKSRLLTDLTVAICTKDRPDNLARCLESLLQLQAEIEILVVDNAPSDSKTQELVAQHSQVRYVCEPRPGLDFARNLAIVAAKRNILAFIDDDVVVDRCWLQGLSEAWGENPDAAAFTGLVLPYELQTQAQIIFELAGGFRRGFEKIRYGKTLPENPLYPCGAGIFGAGCNMAFKRQILIDLGGFDEALDTGATLPGGGDLDIFYRVIRAGYPLVYEPQYLVFHQHRYEMAKLRRQYWSWGLGFMAFIVKSYQTDLEMRSQLRRIIFWWFRYQYRQAKTSLTGRNPMPITMSLAELWGGVVGLWGGYQRSQRRIESIKATHANESTITVKP